MGVRRGFERRRKQGWEQQEERKERREEEKEGESDGLRAGLRQEKTGFMSSASGKDGAMFRCADCFGIWNTKRGGEREREREMGHGFPP